MVNDPLVGRMQGFGTTIFAEMTGLAVRTGSINLGQGFPDTDGPPAMLEAAVEAIRSGANQYPPGPGIPELRAAISAQRAERYGLSYDPHSEILVTVGATEGIATDLVAVTDEVYEYLTFDDASHIALATLPGMRERTVALSSAGKTFSATGWKTGWLTAPAPYVRAVQTVKQFLTYTASAPWQHAVA